MIKRPPNFQDSKWLKLRLRIYLIRSLLGSKSASIKKKCNRVQFDRLPITVCSHELAQLGASFNPKEHLITILKFETKPTDQLTNKQEHNLISSHK